MDNPDYESFLRDYYGIIGALPPTTTARPQKHIEPVARAAAPVGGA